MSTTTTLINANSLDGVSPTFEVMDQVTVYAYGLEPDQRVAFYMVALSEMIRSACGPGCPPMVQLPAVTDEMQLLCCGDPIYLTRDQPWVIIDSPQKAKLRAKLEDALGVPQVPAVQTLVTFRVTNTNHVNDRMRGCACAGAVA